ncbi:MAG: sulfatase [Bacteroidota bacterium]
MKTFQKYATLFLATIFLACSPSPGKAVLVEPPNILFCIADDASFPHMGAYGTSWVNTPGFDRVAREGLLFTRAYTPNAKCAPSRSAILTGRNSWQLEEAANHSGNFPEKFSTFMEVLGNHGYLTGCTGKGWAPGVPGTRNGKPRQLTGKPYNTVTTPTPTEKISKIDYTGNFKDFLKGNSVKGPWAFWYGGYEPHRAYAYGSGVQLGHKSPEAISEVPSFWPDETVVRNDILDYAYEIEYFDSHLRAMIQHLENTGQLENTLIVVTSDNGMPFPRVKGQAYEFSNHMPLAVMWPKGIHTPGRSIANYVSFIDLAPTFLEVAGLEWSQTEMASSPGQSLTEFFDPSPQTHSTRKDFVLMGKERHDVGRPKDVGYPIRGIFKDDYLYIKNYEPLRWPAGNPETGYLNTDGSPTKSRILQMRRKGEDKSYWDMNFGKRVAEELYHVGQDPMCVENLAQNADVDSLKGKLARLLTENLLEQNDPRMLGNGAVFDSYPYRGRVSNFYERHQKGEKVPAGWVNDSDFEIEALK